MTNADLRAAAQAAPSGPWFYSGDVQSVAVTIAADPYQELHPTDPGTWEKTGTYIALASPDRILALLDDLEEAEDTVEAADSMREELERKTAALDDAVRWAPRLRERELVRAALEGTK